MDALMADQDYFKEYLDEKFKNVDGNFERLGDDIKDIKVQSHDTRQRVYALETERNATPQQIQDTPFYRDPQVLKITFILSLVMLILVLIAAVNAGVSLEALPL